MDESTFQRKLKVYKIKKGSLISLLLHVYLRKMVLQRGVKNTPGDDSINDGADSIIDFFLLRRFKDTRVHSEPSSFKEGYQYSI